ncbi:hypothetical protein IFM89_024280 [Coptis chinensis]|uniref:non-specific serine/threonine protein kinase n=1 Tax=Coptis chinensis TaxID=261450 RepID=A0A835LWG0_9MAGN|nr:hypothetical protein IFM89_024280 [Coptis chinensis]
MWNCFKAAQGGRKSSSNRDSPPGTSVYLHGELNWNGQLLPSPNLIIFSFEELKKATDNFGSNIVMGEGRFGEVFKGWIDDKSDSKNGSGYFIAVKRFNTESFESFREWQAEVNLLGRISHPNLVKLLGYCWEEKELLLIYEFMQQGSLESHLFGRGSAVQPLSWNLRLKIVLGAARGLAFLHSSQQIIYRDFKASHILLDGNYNAKLSDFSLAMNGPMGGISPVHTRIMGTYGYAAPEYIATGKD